MGFTTPVLVINDQFPDLGDADKCRDFLKEICNGMNTQAPHKQYADVCRSAHSSQTRVLITHENSILEVSEDVKSFKNISVEKTQEILKNAMAVIKSALSNISSSTTEIERRFLVSKLPKNISRYPKQVINQGYIFDAGHILARVRVVGECGYLTLKGPRNNGKCDEFEYEIPFKDAVILLNKYCTSAVYKTRYTIPHGDVQIELDVFGKKLKGLMIAEVEVPNIEYDINAPAWFGDEITNNHYYSNINLSKLNAL